MKAFWLNIHPERTRNKPMTDLTNHLRNVMPTPTFFLFLLRALLAIVLATVVAFPAFAQNKPTKPLPHISTLANINPTDYLARFDTQVLPPVVAAEESYTVLVTMTNLGNLTWTSASRFYLGSQNPGNNYTWGPNRVSLPGSVPKGSSVTFSINIIAPKTPGKYVFQWQMLQEDVAWFGDLTPQLTIDVVARSNKALFVAQSNVPTSIASGKAFSPTITFKNSGNTTWFSSKKYNLGSQNPENNRTWVYAARVSLPHNVLPGSSVTFTVPAKAPVVTSNQNVNFQWRMVQDDVEWFGDFTPNVVVQVTAPAPTPTPTPTPTPPKPIVSATHSPAPLVSGQAFSMSWSSTNATNVSYSCTNTGGLVLSGNSANASGSVNATALAGWVNDPPNCTWTATGAGGTATASDRLSTTAPSATPVINSVSRNPASMIAGSPFTVTWSTSNATAMSYACVSGSGSTGYNASANNLGANSSINGVAPSAWAGTTSTCTWIATGAGGTTAVYRETVTTNPAVAVEVVTYIHTDGLGSPVAKSDKNGNLISGSRTRYEPYGATAAGATPTIGFTGHVNDANTGLIYMQQRYYDPYAGRFLSTDPVLTDANTGSLFNRYIYANNNPFKYIDPDGREVKIVGTPEFKLQVNAAINKIDSGKRGQVVVAAANELKKTITIKESITTNNTIRPTNSDKTPSDSTILFNPSNTTGGVDVKGGTSRPAFVGLAHELGHAVAAGVGQHSNDRGGEKIGTTPPGEKQPMLFENAVRKDHDLTERAPYYTPKQE